MTRRRARVALVKSVGCLLIGVCRLVLAQTAPLTADTGARDKDTALAEIVVTATRREASAQDIPLAVTAISGETLQQRGISDPSQLSSLAPTLTVDQGYSNGRTNVSIRGLSATSFGLETLSPIATYLDDIYQVSQFGTATEIFDMNRIEVLRGPQGTLFGRNTTGGSLNYYSQTPVQGRTEGYVTVEGGGGDFQRYTAEGAVNLPLTDTLASRLSFRVDHRDGYINNLYDGSELGQYTNFSARLQLGWKPADGTTVNLKLFGLKNHGDGPVYFGLYQKNPCNEPQPIPMYFSCDLSGNPAAAPPGDRQVYSNKPQGEDYDNYGFVLRVDHSIGDYALTSISDVQKGDYDVQTNDMGSVSDFFHSRQMSQSWQSSEELRLATPVRLPLRAVFGLYGQHDHLRVNEGSVSTAYGPGFDYDQDNYIDQGTTSLAAFGSGTYDVNEMLSLVGGVRYTHEATTANLAQVQQFTETLTNADNVYQYAINSYNPAADLLTVFDGDKAWHHVTWDFTGNVKPVKDVLLYAKAATGFRSGGFFPSAAGAAVPFIALKPETVTSYELGFKTEWFDHRLRVNGAAFTMNYSDMQVQTTNSNGAGLLYSNAASSKVKGGELEIELTPLHGLVLSGSAGYTSSVYRNYATLQFGAPINLSGNTLPYAPAWTGNIDANYTLPVDARHDLFFDTDWSYRSRIFFDPNNITSDGAHEMGSVRIGYGESGKGWRITGFVNNLLNEQVKAFAYFVASGNSPLIVPTIYGPLRTWGFEARYAF